MQNSGDDPLPKEEVRKHIGDQKQPQAFESRLGARKANEEDRTQPGGQGNKLATVRKEQESGANK